MLIWPFLKGCLFVGGGVKRKGTGKEETKRIMNDDGIAAPVAR